MEHYFGRIILPAKQEAQSPYPKPKELIYIERVLSKPAQTGTWSKKRISFRLFPAYIHWHPVKWTTKVESILAFTTLTAKKHTAYNTLILKWVIMEVSRLYPLGWPEYSPQKYVFSKHVNQGYRNNGTTSGPLEDSDTKTEHVRLGIHFTLAFR